MRRLINRPRPPAPPPAAPRPPPRPAPSPHRAPRAAPNIAGLSGPEDAPRRPKGRLTATQCLGHEWLKSQATVALDKTRLKRYVIKKRWIKAVNTIIALRRMGAKLEWDDTNAL
ncbi:Uncharacterized protein GBIM_12521 [Gryllus bimaculatus]|nr:Uncharacterized protein GBIM_12521 [Gryllus bimaculatus]